MKRLFLSLIVGVAANMACAQGLHFGIKGGLNVSTLADEYYSERLGWNVGVVAKYDFNSKYGVEADLLYSKQRTRTGLVHTVLEKEYDWIESSRYLQLPMTFKFYPVDKLYVEGGFQLGYLLKKETCWECYDEDLEEDITKTEDATGGSHRFDVGLVGGVGYEFSNGFFVNARYVYGLAHTYKYSYCEDSRFRTFQVCLGYYF